MSDDDVDILHYIDLSVLGVVKFSVYGYDITIEPRGGDIVHVLISKEGMAPIEGVVHISDVNDVSNTLNINRSFARAIQKEIVKIVRERGKAGNEEESVVGEEGPRVVVDFCLSEEGGDGVCKSTLRVYREVYRKGNYSEERYVLYKNGNYIGEFPTGIRRIHDLFFDMDFYVVYVNGVRVISTNIEDLFEELRVKMLVPTPIVTPAIVKVVDTLISHEIGYATPGITENGIIDPDNVLDLNDYGIEGLIEAYRWVVMNYPGFNCKSDDLDIEGCVKSGDYVIEGNAARALANIAFSIAKVITPIVKFHVATFIDYLVWNYGRGGEGKTLVSKRVIIPILGFGQGPEGISKAIIEKVYIVGGAETEARVRNLLSYNRLPLILDEQRRSSLKTLANAILSSVVGLNVIGLHASRLGQGFEDTFMNLRGFMVFTNVKFPEFLSDVKIEASDYAFARRVIEVNWDYVRPDDNAYMTDLNIKPVIGALNRVFIKYRSEFMKSHNLIDLTKKIFIALIREYAINDEFRKRILEDFIRAVDYVVSESMGNVLSYVRTEEEYLVESAYEFVRKLGVQVKSVNDVIDTVLGNPALSGVELVNAEFSDEVQRISDEVFRLFNIGNGNGGNTDELVKNPNVPSSVAKALIEGKVYVRVYAGALGGKIPNAKKFMGKDRIHNPTKRGFYYKLSLYEFLSPFYAKANEEDNEGNPQ